MKQKHFFKYEKWNTKTGIKRTVREGTSTSKQDGVTETRFILPSEITTTKHIQKSDTQDTAHQVMTNSDQ